MTSPSSGSGEAATRAESARVRRGRGRSAADAATGPRPPESGRAKRPLRVRCLVRDQHAHLRPVEAHLGDHASFTYDAEWDPESLRAARPDIVVCVNDWPVDVARCLDAARALGIPTLVLQDGILEWRCQYQNPLFGAGGGAPQHQPVLADRIACIGAQSARQIAAWGNGDKVEVTGMPRLDPLLDRSVRAPRRPGSRLLVMTAKNPGFDRTQRDTTLRSLRAVKEHVERLHGVEVAWRISRGLVPDLGIENRLVELGGAELLDQIEWADAVVTTPSTVMLEAMLLDRPVAALDFHNVPRFVPTAWTISAPEHVEPVIAGILEPSVRRMEFQKDCLADSLRCDGPAAPRVAALMQEMAPAAATGVEPEEEPEARGRRDSGRPPARVPAPLADLYPGRSVFEEEDPRALQARLARAEKELERLREASRAANPLRRAASALRRLLHGS